MFFDDAKVGEDTGKGHTINSVGVILISENSSFLCFQFINIRACFL